MFIFPATFLARDDSLGEMTQSRNRLGEGEDGFATAAENSIFGWK